MLQTRPEGIVRGVIVYIITKSWNLKLGRGDVSGILIMQRMSSVPSRTSN